ncbi:MAG: Rab family GTPase [Pseudomonadales bacterium]
MKFKVCMIGSYAVGKTSLVERYVHTIYSDAYHTTIGVKIDKKELTLDNEHHTCIIWDIAGEDEFYTIRNAYLRGMAGFLLVVDGTRRASVDTAREILQRLETDYANVPFVLLVNKADLMPEWEVNAHDLADLSARSIATFETSALSGAHVDEAFERLVREMHRV